MNDSGNSKRYAIPPVIRKSGAQKRLHAILEGDPLAIRVTNLRARAGQKPASISRHLDRLLNRTRRGPRQTR